jgi:hypothetical protein
MPVDIAALENRQLGELIPQLAAKTRRTSPNATRGAVSADLSATTAEGSRLECLLAKSLT